MPQQVRSFSGRAIAGSFLLTAILDIGLAIVAFNVAKRTGATDQIAYLVSGIGPLTMMLITWVRTKTLSGASLVILVFLVLSSAVTFIGGSDSRLLIVKDSLITGGQQAAPGGTWRDGMPNQSHSVRRPERSRRP